MKKLTPQSVKQLYAVMTQYYDTELIDHWSGDREQAMAVLTLYLQHIGTKDVPSFLAQYHINIDHEIYLPWEPGSLASNGLLPQVLTCAGAHQRIVNARMCDRPVECNLLYLLSPLNRVYVELEAIHAEMEVYWWYSATILEEPLLPAEDYDARLQAYGCSDLGRELADAPSRIERMQQAVKRGEVECDAARDVINFFGWGEATVGR